MAIVVRRAEENDLPALRALQAYPVQDLVDEHFRAQQAGTLLFAVALDGDVIVGSALLDLASEEIPPELRNMFVTPPPDAAASAVR